MAAPLTRLELDKAQCAHPGCDHTSHEAELYLTAVCHKGAPLYVRYQDGRLEFYCATCEEFVCAIAVAHGWQ